MSYVIEAEDIYGNCTPSAYEVDFYLRFTKLSTCSLQDLWLVWATCYGDFLANANEQSDLSLSSKLPLSSLLTANSRDIEFIKSIKGFPKMTDVIRAISPGIAEDSFDYFLDFWKVWKEFITDTSQVGTLIEDFLIANDDVSAIFNEYFYTNYYDDSFGEIKTTPTEIYEVLCLVFEKNPRLFVTYRVMFEILFGHKPTGVIMALLIPRPYYNSRMSDGKQCTHHTQLLQGDAYVCSECGESVSFTDVDEDYYESVSLYDKQDFESWS